MAAIGSRQPQEFWQHWKNRILCSNQALFFEGKTITQIKDELVKNYEGAVPSI